MMKNAGTAWLSGLAIGTMLGLTGCDGFFQKPGSTTTTGAGTGTGNYVYVVNQGTDTVSGFSVGSSVLTSLTNSPYTLATNLVPTSVTVTRQNGFVYVGGNGEIEGFAIGSDGSLTTAAVATTSLAGNVASLAASPTGDWLLVLSLSQNGLTPQATVYGINTATGALTLNGTINLAGSGIATVVPKSIRFAPNGLLAAAALGSAGDALFTFTNATGSLVQTTQQIAPIAVSDNALTFDSTSGYLFVGSTAATGGASVVTAYSVTAQGFAAQTDQRPSGDSPASLEMSSTGTYLYSGNRSGGNISGYSFANGKLTALPNSPYPASPGTDGLVRDNTGSYLIGVSGGSGTAKYYDVTLFGANPFAAGQVDALGQTTNLSSSSNSVAVAATH
jgi:6-phosphogluconolactonase